jgi:hypothetical protein
VKEEPVARPEEVFGTSPAYLGIFAGEVYRACILQILVEGVLGQVIVEKVSLQFDWRNIRLTSKGVSIFQSDFLDLRDCSSLESIGDGCGFSAQLHHPEFNRKVRILHVHHR